MQDDARTTLQLEAIVGFRLTTADLPRLQRFYQEALGFAAIGPQRPIGREELALLGLSGSGRRQALRLGRQVVELDQFDPPGHAYPAADAAWLGFQHLALVVADIAVAGGRLRDAAAISIGGPQLLPEASGGVRAYKFRDPDGHPLELLQFPPDRRPAAWAGKLAAGEQTGLGIDHSAISVADADASVAFYAQAGLRPGARTVNHGPAQQLLDALANVQVAVAPMLPPGGTPHLELLAYQVPRGAAGSTRAANDVAATRIVWRGSRPALLRDPDGHLHQVEPASVDQA